jgi:tetratricopeptide (TPR) repeat protein
VLAALAGIACLGAHSGHGEIARGDAAWARRADGEREGRAPSGPILEAVGFYESALAASPENLEARWKLLRALHFAGDFAESEPAERRAIFERALEASEVGLDGLARRVGAGTRLEELEIEVARRRLEAAGLAPHDVARLYFWSAINWGAWSRTVGLLGAVRQGVANRLHDQASLAIALEPGVDSGGALRLLSRLHAELPRVPFVSDWVDREQALPLIERAYAMAPEHPGNQLLLALTLLDFAPERRGEALELLDRVQRLRPRPSAWIEDLALREAARDRLAADS